MFMKTFGNDVLECMTTGLSLMTVLSGRLDTPKITSAVLP